MPHCPSCGSHRLRVTKRLTVVETVVANGARHRYRCSACGWEGLRQHRRHASRTGTMVWVIVAGFVVVTSLLLLRACGFGAGSGDSATGNLARASGAEDKAARG